MPTQKIDVQELVATLNERILTSIEFEDRTLALLLANKEVSPFLRELLPLQKGIRTAYALVAEHFLLQTATYRGFRYIDLTGDGQVDDTRKQYYLR